MTTAAPEPDKASPPAAPAAPAAPAVAARTGTLSLRRALGLLVATLVAVGLLGQVNPFGLLQEAITRGDEAERMQPVRLDPASIGISQNEEPLKAYRSRPLPPAEPPSGGVLR